MANNYTIPVNERRPAGAARVDARAESLGDPRVDADSRTARVDPYANQGRVDAALRDTDRPFRMIFSAAACCFVGALVTDIVYLRAPDFVWTTFSIWLITIGLLVAAVAAIVGLVLRIAHRRLGTLGSRWGYLIGIVAACVVEIFNAFVHSRDAYESVYPDGIALSAIAVVLLILTPIVGRAVANNRPRKAL